MQNVCFCLSVCLSVCLPACLPACLPVGGSGGLSVYLPVFNYRTLAKLFPNVAFLLCCSAFELPSIHKPDVILEHMYGKPQPKGMPFPLYRNSRLDGSLSYICVHTALLQVMSCLIVNTFRTFSVKGVSRRVESHRTSQSRLHFTSLLFQFMLFVLSLLLSFLLLLCRRQTSLYRSTNSH